MREKLGRLLVLEGTDGAGKSTQFQTLCERLRREGYAHRHLAFPQYQEDSSALIRMYLRGDFGTDPEAVNAYASSAFYAVDRYASYKKDWEQDYLAGALFLADRYTTSNAIYQTAKLQGEARAEYLTWLQDFEYNKMGLPAPTLVIYLDLPTEVSVVLIAQRGDATDIHEKDKQYLASCRETALEIAQQEGWLVISCVDGAGNLRTIADIHEEIWASILPYLCEENMP